MTYSETLQVWNELTDSERFILQEVAAEKVNKQIAYAQRLPLRTIEDRRRRLMTKISAASVVGLVRFIVRCESAGLLPSPKGTPQIERMAGVA